MHQRRPDIDAVQCRNARPRRPSRHAAPPPTLRKAETRAKSAPSVPLHAPAGVPIQINVRRRGHADAHCGGTVFPGIILEDLGAHPYGTRRGILIQSTAVVWVTKGPLIGTRSTSSGVLIPLAYTAAVTFEARQQSCCCVSTICGGALLCEPCDHPISTTWSQLWRSYRSVRDDALMGLLRFHSWYRPGSPGGNTSRWPESSAWRKFTRP